MVTRNAQKVITEMAAGFPAIVIAGPRQCGKTTLARMTFGDKPYVSLEDLDVRSAAASDPRGFLGRFPNGAIFDEIQNVPELLPYLQSVLDASPDICGRFILTGSRQFSLMERVTQSLAGRVGILQLTPFAWNECFGGSANMHSLPEIVLKGMFPPVWTRSVNPALWYSSYVQSYLERDVRNQLVVQNLHAFERFIRLCAGRAGQILNIAQLAVDASVAANTAKAWLSVLEAAGIVFFLHPYQMNVNKRLVKSPKLYLWDSGLACWLLGIESEDALRYHPLWGALVETAFVVEAMKYFTNLGRQPNLYYWRDSSGLEIDLVEEKATGLLPIEFKSGVTYQREWGNAIRKWRKYIGDKALPGKVVYGGDIDLPDGDVSACSWRNLCMMF